MELIEELKILENTYHSEEPLLIAKNNSSVLLTNISNELVDNTYLRAITRYIAANTSASYIVNTKESIPLDATEIKNIINTIIFEQNVKLVINITSTKEEHDIVYKIGKSLDFTIQKELEESFKENLITNIKREETPEQKNYDYIEISISNQYHDIDDAKNVEMLCASIIQFIKMYSNFAD